MKAKRFAQTCYVVLAIFLLLLLIESIFADTPLGKSKPVRSEPGQIGTNDHSGAEVAHMSASVYPGAKAELSIRIGDKLVKMEVGIKHSTIGNKDLTPLKVSLEPAKISEVTYQNLPRRFYVPPDTAAYSFTIKDSSGKSIDEKEIKDSFLLAMGYPGYIKPELAKKLRVSVFSKDRWLPLPSRYDAPRRMIVTESAKQSGVYQLLAVDDAANQNIIAYPNPIQFGEFGGVKRTVKFMNVPLGAVVEIYTVTGDKIREIEAEASQVSWDGEKEDGELVTSGLYIYRVQMPGDEAFGKIAVLR